MKEINQFARKTAQGIRKNDLDVKIGNILLQTKDQDDDSMPLPSKYRLGGSDYNKDTTNYVDVAVVAKQNPIEILHMTKEGLKVEKDLSKWDYACILPYIEEEKAMTSAMVFAEKEDSVKLYARPSFACEEIIVVPNSTKVMVGETKGLWVTVSYNEKNYYTLSKYVQTAKAKKGISDVDMKELEKAYKILGKILGYVK